MDFNLSHPSGYPSHSLGDIMKLIFCKNCKDIFSLNRFIRKCLCGQSKGRYTGTQISWYSGEHAIPLGFDNISFMQAIDSKDDEFIAFRITDDCPTFRRKDET